MRQRSRPRRFVLHCRDLGAHFLTLEDHVADDEQHDRARYHADGLRPGDQHALGQSAAARRAPHPEAGSDRSARATAWSDRATPPPSRQTDVDGDRRASICSAIAPSRASAVRVRCIADRSARSSARRRRPSTGQMKVMNSHRPSVTSAAVAAERKTDREQQRQRQPDAGIDDRHQEEQKAARRSPRRPAGCRCSNRPSPMTSSHSAIKLIASVSKPGDEIFQTAARPDRSAGPECATACAGCTRR